MNYIHWRVNPVIFEIFGIPVQYYGVLFVSGLLAAIWVLNKIFEENEISKELLEKLITYSVIGVFIGARLGHCLFYEPGYFLSHPIEMILPISPKTDGGYVFTGYRGLSSHGGAIGLLSALAFYCFNTRQNLIRMLDYIAIVAPVAACFIRIGNLMNSEIIGKPATVPWAFIFERIDNIPRHPAQLYESIAYLIIFIMTVLLYKKSKNNKNSKNSGFFFGIVLVSVFIFRFFIEFIKENQVYFENAMTLDMGQILSIPFIITGIIFIVYSQRIKNCLQNR